MPKIGMEPLRRKALIDAAIAAIGDRGSLDVTMSDIASRAGVSSALAHHYFGAKDDLLQRHDAPHPGRARRATCVRRLRKARHAAPARLGRSSRSTSRPCSSGRTRCYAWLAFYVEAQHSAPLRRLLRVYARRLHSNLMSGLLPPDAARRRPPAWPRRSPR